MESLTRKLPAHCGKGLIFTVLTKPRWKPACDMLVGGDWVGNGISGCFLKEVW